MAVTKEYLDGLELKRSEDFLGILVKDSIRPMHAIYLTHNDDELVVYFGIPGGIVKDYLDDKEYFDGGFSFILSKLLDAYPVIKDEKRVENAIKKMKKQEDGKDAS
jgi:hypothetical protein